MSLRDLLKRHLGDPAADAASTGDLEHTVQKRLFLCMATIVVMATGAYAAIDLRQGRTDAMWTSLAAFIAAVGCSVWAVRTDHYAWPLRVLGAGMVVLLARRTLVQGELLPAAGWWMSVLPFILAGGGLYRLAIAAVLTFVGMVTLLHFAPATVAALVPSDAAVAPWRRYVAIVGSEMLALTLIILAMRWRMEVARTLDAARAAATEASDVKARFLANISHEIRTPLNGIIGAAELLDSPRLSPDQRLQLLGLQRQSARTLLALVNDVLDVAKLDAGKVVLEARPVMLRRLVFESTELFSVQASAKGIELTSSCSPDVPEVVRGDPTRLRQIVHNLVGNAVKFTASGGVHLHLSVDGVDPSDVRDRGAVVDVRIDVEDSGPGLTEPQIARLFTAFSQGDSSTTRRFGGTGLGLNIAQELAQLMGGRIAVRSTPGVGSHFTLIVPLEAESPAPAWRAPMPRPDIVVATASGGVERHLKTVLQDLAVQPTVLSSLPSDDTLGDCRLLIVDAPLLGAIDVPGWLAAQARARRRVALLTPLGEDNAVGAAGNAVLVYKPVRRKAMQALLDSMGAADDAAFHAATEPAPLAHEGFAGLHVLVAEDNPVNQIVVQAMLAELGATCVLASDGAEALARAATAPYDAVLMDMQMPTMDGLTATRALRQRERADGRFPVPIVAMTAHAEHDEGAACQAAGMDAFLSKPFGLTQLRRALDTALAARSG